MNISDLTKDTVVVHIKGIEWPDPKTFVLPIHEDLKGLIVIAKTGASFDYDPDTQGWRNTKDSYCVCITTGVKTSELLKISEGEYNLISMLKEYKTIYDYISAHYPSLIPVPPRPVTNAIMELSV